MEVEVLSNFFNDKTRKFGGPKKYLGKNGEDYLFLLENVFSSYFPLLHLLVKMNNFYSKNLFERTYIYLISLLYI